MVLINNDLLPTTPPGNTLQSGMADSREKFILDSFVPTDSTADAATIVGLGKRRSAD